MARNQNFEDMMDANAATHRASAPKPQVDHLRISNKDGDFKVEHHFKGAERLPVSHVFTPEEHEQLMAHLSKHLGIKAGGEDVRQIDNYSSTDVLNGREGG